MLRPFALVFAVEFLCFFFALLMKLMIEECWQNNVVEPRPALLVDGNPEVSSDPTGCAGGTKVDGLTEALALLRRLCTHLHPKITSG